MQDSSQNDDVPEPPRVRTQLVRHGGAGGGGIRGFRPPPVVLKSIAPPQDHIHVNSSIRAGDVSSSDEEDLVNEANGGGREAIDEVRLGKGNDLPVSVFCDSSPSNNETENDNDSDDYGVGSALRVLPIHSIFSPNGKFRRSVSSSWQRGQLLGSGSYGTVYEGFTE